MQKDKGSREKALGLLLGDLVKKATLKLQTRTPDAPTSFQKAIPLQPIIFQSAPANQEVTGSNHKRPPQHFWGVLSRVEEIPRNAYPE